MDEMTGNLAANLEADSGAHISANGHNGGAVETILVHEGTLDVTIAGDRRSVPAGSAIRFPATGDHEYENGNPETVKAAMIISYRNPAGNS